MMQKVVKKKRWKKHGKFSLITNRTGAVASTWAMKCKIFWGLIFTKIWFKGLVSSWEKTISLINEEKIALWSSGAEQNQSKYFHIFRSKLCICVALYMYKYIYMAHQSVWPCSMYIKNSTVSGNKFLCCTHTDTIECVHVRTCTHWQQRMPNLPQRLHSDWMSDAADSCTHHSVLWIHYLLCSSKHWFISLRPKSKRTHVPAHAKKKWKKKNQQIN